MTAATEMHVAMVERLSAFASTHKLDGWIVARPDDVPTFNPAGCGFGIVASHVDSSFDLWHLDGETPLTFGMSATEVLKRIKDAES